MDGTPVSAGCCTGLALTLHKPLRGSKKQMLEPVGMVVQQAINCLRMIMHNAK